MADNMNCFEIDNLSFAYGDKNVIDYFSVQIKKGRVTTIMGPNGSGKSTLLYLMTRELKDYTGSILLDGHDIKEMKGKSFARKAAAVHQYNTVPWDISVRKLVAYGRIPHKNLALGTTTKEDEEAIETALEITGLKELENREVARLSGGQQQRVWIAMALAQETEILFLDEPTTYLDIRYQLDILGLVRDLNEKRGLTVIMVLHDINQALRYSDDVIAMKDGKIHASGCVAETVSEKMIKEVYDVNCKMIEVDNMPYVIT